MQQNTVIFGFNEAHIVHHICTRLQGIRRNNTPVKYASKVKKCHQIPTTITLRNTVMSLVPISAVRCETNCAW